MIHVLLEKRKQESKGYVKVKKHLFLTRSENIKMTKKHLKKPQTCNIKTKQCNPEVQNTLHQFKNTVTNKHHIKQQLFIKKYVIKLSPLKSPNLISISSSHI